eukprot:CAMPEP_0169093762 /NCGR_PEP_ID=MMETSP1015-20121227/17607_1 /TAXON_ID=342587 /ORGANISM="Karlodinium micrum, Strain CCMP2283" /LENGTH=201 /DNA_ID=CAMNT_0009154419 /DNA_START=136 /DNA_END=738 /DNA_ORIENTATION=+
MTIEPPYLVKGVSMQNFATTQGRMRTQRHLGQHRGIFMYFFRTRIALIVHKRSQGSTLASLLKKPCCFGRRSQIRFTLRIKGKPPVDPINVERARWDLDYNQCGDAYNIVAGAPANFHDEPCIFEVDAVKKGGPFTNPESKKGYPNYSFFIPGHFWMPGLYQMLKAWIETLASKYGKYDVLFHPNTGCEVRDHMEERSVEW